MSVKTGHLCLLVLCATFSTTVWCADFKALYTQTKLTVELESCTNRSYNEQIQNTHTSTKIRCGQLCSSVEDCRRFMYDKETKSCSLFKFGENCLTTGAVEKKVCYKQNFLCDGVNCTRCPVGYYGDRCQHIIQDCSEGSTLDLYPEQVMLSFIQPSVNGPIIEVICNFNAKGWTWILNRDLDCLEIDFNRTFDEYSKGFGNPLGNYFVGLDNIHNLLRLNGQITLSPVFNFFDSPLRKGFYKYIEISNKTDNYRLSIGSYNNNRPEYCGDSLTNGSYSLNGRPFSTFDRDFTNHSCPVRFGSGWWYLDDPVCSRSNLHGKRSGADFQSTWHWQDNLGNKTSFKSLLLRFKRS
ncbi:ficolin-3-like [Patella vulgata]|uniref:ficolin-3-like n=1 Tax=Patella vulgata TaxID=6465 RepID=UPI0021805983|nr:ficolin-3-like [Patella vulgata]